MIFAHILNSVLAKIFDMSIGQKIKKIQHFVFCVFWSERITLQKGVEFGQSWIVKPIMH